MKDLRRPAGLVAGVIGLGLLAAGPAIAAPVTVQLRIEGASRTLFEGPVTTDVRPFHFTAGADHECDATAANQGTSPTPVPTRGAALAAAPVTTTGTWSDTYGNPSFDTVAGESVAFDPATSRYLVEYKNATAASVGSCADPVQDGDRVLFAYATGSEQLLELAGPGRAAPGSTVQLTVTDAATHAPVAGAAVGGGSSDANGSVTVGPLARGDNAFKATKPGAIRSNALDVCATDGSDGACGSPPPGTPCQTDGADGRCGTIDRRAPTVSLIGIRNGRRYGRRHAPRTLHGTVTPDPSGLKGVQLRLKRRAAHRRCAVYDGRRERFVRSSCYRNGRWIDIGDRQEWSYLLPSRLGPGRYTLEVYATDGAGNPAHRIRRTFRVA
jgi:hypothetical protein